MLVWRLIEKLSENTSIWIKEGHVGSMRYNVKDGIAHNIDTDVPFEEHLNKAVARFHVEPNLEDDGSINWKFPCRLIIEVKENYYPNKKTVETVRCIQEWINGK